MNTTAYLPSVLGVTLLLGCSTERTEEPQQVLGGVATEHVATPPNANETEAVCNQFSIITETTDSTLLLSLDTDLPDDTIVMVSVSRSYWETGSSVEYGVDYFEEKSTVGQWRSAQEISIADEEWNSVLADKQRKMSRLGLGFNVASVSDTVAVSMIVPINQPDPRFGMRNENLSGTAVPKDGLRIVEDEVELDRPLSMLPELMSPLPSLDPQNLDVGETYSVSRQTPLMPDHSPADPIAAIQQMKHVPEGGTIKILKVFKEDGSPWYEVIASSQNGGEIGKGWVNSTALLGQQLSPTE